MTALYPDSHPKIEALQIELIRRMPPWQKFAVLEGLNEMVKALAISGIQHRHPNATSEQVQRMLAGLILGEDLTQKVYGEFSNAK